MSVPFEKELDVIEEKLLQGCRLAFREPNLHKDDMQFGVMLRELLPLLQAGQAMRDAAPGTDFDRLTSAWDAERERLAGLGGGSK